VCQTAECSAIGVVALKTMAKKSPNAIDRQVAARVRMRRLMLDMSQQQLAAGLGISFQQVQKYEKGSNRIGASRLQQIAEILEVPVSSFFEDFPWLEESKRRCLRTYRIS
jgi:transcriptional regulator with XRE-family HTH domain